MTLELIPDGWENGPLILFWGGGPAEVAALRAAFRQLASGIGGRVAFHGLPFVAGAANAGLLGVSSSENQGVVLSGDVARSEWILTPSWWNNVEGVLEPFSDAAAPPGGYQFLHQGIGVPVIYSTSRRW